MNPYMSWAIVLVVAGGLGYYYSNTSKAPKGKAPTRLDEKIEMTVPPVKPKKQKPRKQSDSTAATAKKVEEQPAAQVETANDEDDVDTKEFARRLAAARSGVSVGETKTKAPKGKRAKATPLAQESTGSDFSTQPPSSNGADADDDLSSTDFVSTSAGDVSDMLEKPAPGPSVLRLTGSMETKEKKTRAPTFKQVETKKQRQNRLKNEARKEANQESETERRKLLEKQLRTAREAERREAATRKPSAAPASNAWTSSQSSTNGNHTTAPTTPAPAVTDALPLLDTFEPTSSSNQAGSSSGTWTNNLPPEDEQMRILGVSSSAVDEDWTTVSSKKEKTKKKTKADEDAYETPTYDTATTTEPEIKPEATEWVAPKVTQVPVPRGKNHPLDSDWAA